MTKAPSCFVAENPEMMGSEMNVNRAEFGYEDWVRDTIIAYRFEDHRRQLVFNGSCKDSALPSGMVGCTLSTGTDGSCAFNGYTITDLNSRSLTDWVKKAVVYKTGIFPSFVGPANSEVIVFAPFFHLFTYATITTGLNGPMLTNRGTTLMTILGPVREDVDVFFFSTGVINMMNVTSTLLGCTYSNPGAFLPTSISQPLSMVNSAVQLNAVQVQNLTKSLDSLTTNAATVSQVNSNQDMVTSAVTGISVVLGFVGLMTIILLVDRFRTPHRREHPMSTM